MTHPVGHGSDTDEAEDAPFKVLTPEEAQALRQRHPMVSPWVIVGAQALIGLLCVGLTWVITQRSAAAWSALYGAAAVVFPGALMARGMTRRAGTPMAVVTSFMLWELMKLALAVAILVAAVRWAPDLSWPALLVTMVVCMKLSWLALLQRRRW